MKIIKKIIKRMPGVRSTNYLARGLVRSIKQRNMTTEAIFTDTYNKNYWQGNESVSGRGSDRDQTAILIRELPQIFQDLEVQTLLDVPCGDFQWMKNIDLAGIDYLGGDIVKEIIESNQVKYARDNIRFRHVDLTTNDLPKFDLVLCRDCLVHLSFQDVFSAFHNICASGSRYLLTTTFVNGKRNRDIVNGMWRTLNLEAAPFNFPQPKQVIVEGCPEEDGSFADKTLGLWRVADIQQCLVARGKRAA